MKKFLLLANGFEKPTPEVMAAWGSWFQSISEHCVDQGAPIVAGKAVTKSGIVDQSPMANQAPNGYTIIKAENLNDAVELVKHAPVVESLQVLELMDMGGGGC